MKLRQLITTLAAAVGIVTAAQAATPVAVWDGDFKTTTKGGYTLTTSTGHTVAADGSTITIGNSATTGVKVSGGDIYTIVVKARGYTPTSSGNPEVIAAMLNDNNSYMGLGSKADKKGWYIWNNGAWGDSHVTSSAIINDTNSHKYTVSYTYSATGALTQGTTIYMDNTQLAAETGLRGSALAKATSATIGGPQSGSLAVAKGLVIEGIAIFDSTVPTATAAKYHFPSSPVRTISINFGSSYGEVSGTYGIVPSSTWNNFSDKTASDGKTANVSDGSTVTVKWWSKNLYGYGATDAALKGYLDDGACGDGSTSDGPHIAVTGIPFAYYDVIVYYATDTTGAQFNPAAFKKWTGTTSCGDQSDSWDGTKRLARNDANLKFGTTAQPTAVVGTNVSYMKRCFSYADLDIKGGKNGNSARGGIAAIQIVECDPHGSEMYFNRLAGDEVTIPAGTYGNIKTLAPIKATQYTGSAPTALALSGSTTEIGGDAQYIQGQHVNTRTHMISGWFRCDGLDGEKMLYAALAYGGGHGGYKVTVDANGAINVGKCDKYGWNGTALKSANGVIEADKWYYITVAVDSAKPDAATATAKVCVNGAAIAFPTGTFATNLNGNDKTIELSIGQGVSAAGLYADFSATGDAGLSASLATNEKYVFIKKADYTLDMSQDASSSTAAWSPERTGALYPVDTLTVNDIADGAVTLTFDEDVAVKKISATSEAGKELTLAKEEDRTVSAAEGYDFSGADGKVTVGFDTGAAPITAGADTVLNGAGTGTLTIGTGNQATVKNWSGANLAGAGTVVYNADAAATAVAPGAFAGGFTGSIKLAQGTWTCSDNYPQTRPVTLSGENAKFILNKQDGMGYGNNLPVFTVENGATFEVDKRDTFNRTLALKNGGKFVLKQDNNDSGRSFDFYSAAALTVDGTCTVGGLTAESTSNSGILAIRRSNFTVTVSDDSELQCYSAWATAAGNGGNFKKAGAGKMIQYRDSTSALPFVVEGGTLQFVNGGRTTTAGITLASGAKLELSATGDGSYTLANAIAGEGRVEKQDSGVYTLSGANTYSGTTTVKAGTLKVTGSSVGTGNYTVDEGATLELGQVHGVTVEGASAGKVIVTLTDAEKESLDNGEQVELIGVTGDTFAGTLETFDGTGAAYQIEEPEVSGGKIVVQRKEDARTPPFNLTVSEDGDNFWESFGWLDSNPDEAQTVQQEDWNLKVGASIVVSDGATATMTVGAAVPITLATLNIANGNKLTITRDDDATITADAIDDSASTGTTTLDITLGATPVAAGANTVLTKVGTGAYTIGEGKQLTIRGGSFLANQIANSGMLNLEGGTAENPIGITGNANLGTVTLAADTYVVNDDKGTSRKYTITGSGATSFYTVSRNGTGAPGMLSGSAFSNVIIGSTTTSGDLWIEHGSFDENGTVGLDVTGNMRLNDLATPIVIRSLNGSKELHGQDFTIKCLEDANFKGSSSQAITIAAGDALQTFSGAYTGALTVNEDAQVKLTGSANPSSIANAGTVILDFGTGTTNFLNASSKYNGTLEVASGVAVVFDGFNGTATATGSGEVFKGYTVGINNNGKFTVPSGVDPDTVKLYTAAGAEVPITGIEGQVISFDLSKYGKTCLMEYLFAGNLASTGSDTGSLQFDGSHCFPGNEYVTNAAGEKVGGIYAASAPWRDVAFPAEVTVVMYGKVMKTDNTCQIGIGSTTGGSRYSLFLASGDVAAEEVKLCYAYKNGGGNVEAKGVLCTMSVPHAQTTDHLYAFTMKKVGNDTVINIYLDGEVLQPYTFAGQTVTLGSGIQLGSIHGGIGDSQTWPADFGFKRSTAAETDATLQFVRVYDVVLNDTVMREISKDYPYASPAGSFSRELTGDGSWVAAGAWTKALDPNVYDQPDAGSAVTVTPAAEDVDLTVNIDADAAYETLTVNQGGKVVFKADAEKTGIVNVSGKTTISTDVELDYDAIRVNGAVSIAAGKTVKIDLTSIDLRNYWVDTPVKVTGPIVGGSIEQIEVATAENAEGRTCSFAYNPSTLQTELDITVPKADIVGTVGAEGAITWTWGEGNTLSTTPDWTKVAATIIVPEGISWDYDVTGMNITNVVVNGTADIGTTRGLTFAGTGTVKATVTEAEIAAGTLTVFTKTSDATLAVALVDEQGETLSFPGAYNEQGQYVVTFYVNFTVADVSNATKTVEGATQVEGNAYKALPGAHVTVTYTADPGYFFAGGSKTSVVEVTAAKNITITTETERELGAAYIVVQGTTTTNDYYTFDAAITAAVADDTVTLLKDIETATAQQWTIAKNITIDFADKTIEKTVANDWVFTVANGADVIFTGTTGGIVHYPAVLNQGNPASMIQILGKLTVNGGVYESDYTVFKVDEDGGCSAAGELVVNGGSFTIAPRPDTTYTGLTFAVMNWSKATLNGGAFTGDVTTLSSDGNATVKAGETIVDAAKITGKPVYKLQVTGSTYVNVPKIKGVAIANVTLVKSASITDELELVEDGEYVTVQKKDSGPYTPGMGGGTVERVPGEAGVYVVQADPSSKTVTIAGGLKDTDTIRVTTAEDITVVGVPANQIEVKIDGTVIPNGAFVGGDATGFSTALNKDGEVTIGEETIKVQPTVVAASEGTIAEGAVATKAIPGLTYTLKRGTVLGTYDVEADTAVAETTTVSLKDTTETKPADKAFYQIQVSK